MMKKRNWWCSSALLTAVFSAATTFAPPAQQAKWCQRQQVLQLSNSLQALRAEVSRLRQELRAMKLICFSFSEIRSIQSRTSLTIWICSVFAICTTFRLQQTLQLPRCLSTVLKEATLTGEIFSNNLIIFALHIGWCNTARLLCFLGKFFRFLFL